MFSVGAAAGRHWQTAGQQGGAAERAAGRRGAATENPNADCFKTIRRHAVAADAARTHTIATKKLSGLLRAKERAKDMVKEPQRVGSSN